MTTPKIIHMRALKPSSPNSKAICGQPTHALRNGTTWEPKEVTCRRCLRIRGDGVRPHMRKTPKQPYKPARPNARANDH